jgi:methionyl-tRNA formyltransferase
VIKIRALFYCGHESRYGLAHLEPLLRSEVFQIEEIVLASSERWEWFRSKLSGVPTSKSMCGDRAFESRCKAVLRRIHALGDIKVSVVFDVNEATEVERAQQYDLAVCAAYPQIFSSSLLAAPKFGSINFHPSYLPRCRGAHPVYWTIASGEPYGGVSCHMMEETIDSGPLLAQRRINFDREEITYDRLYELVEAETPFLCKDVETFLTERRRPIPQQGVPSYFRNEREADRKISFVNETLERTSAKVRAGGAFAFRSSARKVFLYPPASVVASSVEASNVEPGRVVGVHGDQVTIGMSGGCLIVKYKMPPQEDRLERCLRRFRLLENRGLELRVGDTLV